ncbi:amine sulfotransferase-like isoform X1 [Chiloscyllium plagiosum]|uniref:amine sulfotransferase-like isoform X1 n=1 Tax=Chiloscyllium plagiosum TaxID=36176 RepID=UPI001CB7FA51|nr:amine sulfotransferase-like isoform X1 [Chiloscyllium plagiosum]XP_043540904.1 amine sulfotransferase-like isoform X1 [Chiloscyllium plagiosum]
MTDNHDLFEYKGCNFISNIHTTEYLEELINTEIRDGDVIAVTYPKSGTVWMQQILTLIFSNGDLAAVQNKLPVERVPWVEVPTMCFLTLPSPRLAVSHLPYHLSPEGLKKTGKVIYIYRNPKDVVVSLYHFQNYITLLKTPSGFGEFLEMFIEGKVIYGSWFDHIQNWYAHRNEFNILFMCYEEMKLDLRTSVQKICKFLGKELDNEKLDTIVKHCTFEIMKVNPMANYENVESKSENGAFLRKGIIGDWKTHFTVAQSEMFDKLFEERMKDFPLKFIWDGK